MLERLLPVMKKEFLHLWRDPRALALIIFLPVFLLFLYGYAASFDVKNIPLGVLDRDRSAASRNFISGFTHSGYFDLIENLTSDHQFADRMDGGRLKVIINLPPDFSGSIAAGKKAGVQVLVDGSDPIWASSAQGYIAGIAQEYYQERLRDYSARRGARSAAGPPLKLDTRTWYNETMRSLNFFVPGLICIILMQMAATLTSLTVVSEKEQGTMEGLVVSPVRKNELMLGKVLPYVIIAFADVLAVTAVGVFWFQVPFKGSLFFLTLSSLVFLTGAMGIGVLISTRARSSPEAMQTAILTTMLPSLLLSGFVFPIENMPFLLRGISLLVPARYFLAILRGIFLKGVGLRHLWSEFVPMTALSAFIITASVRSFRKRID